MKTRPLRKDPPQMIMRIVGKNVEVNGHLIPLPQSLDIKLSPSPAHRRIE